MNGDRSQRWRDRREAYVPNASVIDPSAFAVDVLDERAAKAFVTQHHYSGTFPAARLSTGLFRGRQLVGVAVFSVPMNNAAIPMHTGLAIATAGADLGRLVLLDDVEGNGETWFLSRAFRLLRREKPGILAVTSYADPQREARSRRDDLSGHVGRLSRAGACPLRTPDG